jgi:hypothetical protein
MWILLFPVLFMFVILGVIILVPAFTRARKEKKRTQQLQATATQLGWNFAASVPLNMIPGLERFALFNEGQDRQIKNFICGEASGIKAAVFDYFYVTGFGNSPGVGRRQIHAQSVVYLEPGYLRVPYFTLRPENFLSKIFTAFGYQDIDFGQRPEFSRQYVLRGQDEQAIRQTFNDPAAIFLRNVSWNVHGWGREPALRLPRRLSVPAARDPVLRRTGPERFESFPALKVKPSCSCSSRRTETRRTP